jgi:hypothetical protein
MTLFWDVVLCSLVKVTKVTEVLAASIIRAMKIVYFVEILFGILV